MKTPPFSALAFGLIGLAAITLLAIGAPDSRVAPPPPPRAAPPPPSVSANGFTLASSAIELPVDDQVFPAGPNVDVVNANCTSCHSASMALVQPALSADQWKATVTKMREVYQAPIAERDVPAILTYLTALTATGGAAPPPAKP
jgi:hypothetical protein